MDHLSSFLQKIKDRLGVEEEKLDIVVEVIKKATGVTLPITSFSIKKGTLVITATPTIKMALFSKREAILQECQKQGIKVTVIR